MNNRLDEVLDPCMTVLKDGFELKEGEVFLTIVHSDHDGEVAELMAACAYSLGASATTFKIVGGGYNKEPDKALVSAMCEADAILAICPIGKTKAERKARAAGARIIHAPFLQRDILIRLMKADAKAIFEKCILFEEKLTAAERFTMKSDLGTEFQVNIKGKTGFTNDGMAKEKGDRDIVPPAQVGIAPVSGTGEGKIVADGCVRPGGVVKEPLTLEVESGFIRSISGGSEAKLVEDYINSFGDRETWSCPAHIGPGMNPAALLCDNLLEAERVEGHITVGIGRNIDIKGGEIDANGHTDVTLTNVNVLLDDELVIQGGKLII